MDDYHDLSLTPGSSSSTEKRGSNTTLPGGSFLRANSLQQIDLLVSQLIDTQKMPEEATKLLLDIFR